MAILAPYVILLFSKGGIMSEIPDLKEIFGAAGRLAEILPGYDVRSQQVEMSEMIFRGLQEKRHILVEAGTGTGKTLAYLAPAILSKKKVVISTGTKALQEQLYYKDVPLLRKALSLPFFVTYMKGRSNYLCLTRLQEFIAFPLFDNPGDAKLLKTLQEWAEKTKTGDLDELSLLGENVSFGRRFNAGTETCLGGKCPDLDRCFITAMRRDAAKADLLIVNHHLFFADLSVKEKGYGEVIPEYDAVIFDEAHMIEEVATQHFGLQISNYSVGELIRDTRQGLREIKGAKELKGLEEICAEIDEYASGFFSTFLGGQERVRLEWDTIDEDSINNGKGLIRELNRLEQKLKSTTLEIENLTSCAGRAGELSRGLQFIINSEEPDVVYWSEVRGRGVFLHASPIDVSETLNERVFSKVSCAVLTSATLTAGKSFEFIKKRLGLTTAEERSFPSPFDYSSQTLLYLPRIKSEPNGAYFMQEAADQIQKILEKTRGRAFVLFTSNRHLHGVHALLQEKVGYTLLKQGDDSREALLARFREETESVLLATRSFWQGIDVQGEALSCVIIDKLPFASPKEPLLAARIESIRKMGGNPFLEYQVPEAAISLKQGFGRLIRNKEDRGVLSILDKRILTRPYGKFFLQSLPPYPVIHDAEEIQRVFTWHEKRASIGRKEKEGKDQHRS